VFTHTIRLQLRYVPLCRKIIVATQLKGIYLSVFQVHKIFRISIVIVLFADEITASFRRFGPLVVDWPHKAESKSYFPPKGYAFLLFQVK